MRPARPFAFASIVALAVLSTASQAAIDSIPGVAVLETPAQGIQPQAVVDAKGAIQSCKVVASSGDAPPDYGCNEAKQEQFKAEANADATDRQAFMTVLAYGHLEQIA